MPFPTETRLARLRERMRETGSDLVAIGPGSHMQWLIGYHPHADERPCLLLIGKEREAFLMPALNAEGTREHTTIAFHNWADEEGPAAALGAALTAIDAGAATQVVIDETMRADFALLLLDALRAARRSFTETTIGALRMRKDESELALLKASAAIADAAMQQAFSVLKPGMTERAVAAEIRAAFLANGAQPAFWIVGSGGNGAFPHHSASDRVLQEGDAVVLDIGGIRNGYPSDMTRMAVIGRAPEGFGPVHAIVERAVQAALAAVRPGVTAAAVDAAARGVISDAGYGAFFVHRTGHGLGIDIHEPPYIRAGNDMVLEEGMVFSIEPGIYLPGRFGIRLEDIVAVRADGPEILSALSRDTRVIAA